MNQEEAQFMLKAWMSSLATMFKTGATLELEKEEVEQVIILLRSYLMTFEKGYPFD